MSVKMQPTNVIMAHLGIEPNGRIETKFASICATHMDKYVPFDKGDLADYKIEGNKVIYDQLYASYQYKGISKSGNPLNYQKSMHEQAGPYWDRRMISAEMQDVVKDVQDEIGR